MASASSREVRYFVFLRNLRATEGILSPRCAWYKLSPGGTTKGAGGWDCLAVVVLAWITFAACGFSPRAVGETKLRAAKASRDRKAAALRSENLGTDILRNEVLVDCGRG